VVDTEDDWDSIKEDHEKEWFISDIVPTLKIFESKTCRIIFISSRSGTASQIENSP
jgi:hypothetical protein